MSPARMLVLLASAAQIGAGLYFGYGFLQQNPPSWLGLLVCGMVVVVGLASLISSAQRMRLSQSRQSTMKLNAVILMVVLGIGAIMIVLAERNGAADERIQFLMMVHGAIAAPFLLNCFALNMIERKVRRTA